MSARSLIVPARRRDQASGTSCVLIREVRAEGDYYLKSLDRAATMGCMHDIGPPAQPRFRDPRGRVEQYAQFDVLVRCPP
jgi:hypothetical protein